MPGYSLDDCLIFNHITLICYVLQHICIQHLLFTNQKQLYKYIYIMRNANIFSEINGRSFSDFRKHFLKWIHTKGTKLFFRFVNIGHIRYILCIQLNDFVDVNQNKINIVMKCVVYLKIAIFKGANSMIINRPRESLLLVL